MSLLDQRTAHGSEVMQDLVIILWVGDWRPSYKWYCTASSGVAGRSDQNGQFQVWWETSAKPSLPQYPAKRFLSVMLPMACGNMSGNNFFNNVRRASNAPLTVDQWRRPMANARWFLNQWAMYSTCGLSKHLEANGWFRKNSGRRVWPLPPTLSCQPCRCIHFLNKENWSIANTPWPGLSDNGIYSTVKQREKSREFAAWNYKHAVWPRIRRAR